MKYTNKIEITNVYNEKVIIKPVPYNYAIEVIETMEDHSLTLNEIGKLFVKLYDKGMDGLQIKQNDDMKKLMALSDELDKKENDLRNKHDYWYCGLDNLDTEDKLKIENKYPRRKNN